MSKHISGGEALLRSLLEEGVETIFGYPGGAIMPVYDEMYHYTSRLNHILTRHEQGAVHAAQGYARVSGKVGVCIATSGPGATNLITGIADAMLDSTPLVCITGQVGAHLLGSDAFQETDFIGMSMPVTKWNYQITTPDEVPAIMAKAFYVAATGRPGPVVIDITKNAQMSAMSHEFEYQKCTNIRSYIPENQPQPLQIEAAAKAINSAKKPFALIGQGVVLANAEKEVVAMLEKANIPFGWTILGKSAIPASHPLNMGMLGMHGNYGPNKKTNECDVLIAIGMRFDDRVTSDVKAYAPQATVVHFEIDKAEISKNIKAHAPVLGNVKHTIPLVTDLLHKASHSEWIGSFAECDKVEHEKVINAALAPASGPISMAEAIHTISTLSKGDSILITDVGQHQMMAVRYYNVNNTRSVVTSGGMGTMGFGLPAAIGAKVARPDKNVVLFVGDGGIQMTIQELGTIMQSDIAVKIVLLNNGFLGMVRQWQELFHQKRYSSTPLASPDFMTLAKAYDIKARQVTERKDLKEAVQEMLDSPKAYLLEVKVLAEENVFPMIPGGAPLDKIIFGE